MLTSSEIDQISAALVAAQAALKPVAKTGRNPHFKTMYSTLDDIWTAAAEALRANGLAVLQHPEPGPDGILALETRIVHTSGQWVASTLTMPLAKLDPQGYGSAMTYARRYGLQAMLGISGLEDDDAEQATGRAPARAEPQNGAAPPVKGEPPASTAQLKALHAAGSAVYGDRWDEKRPALVEAATKGRTTSSKGLTSAEASRLIDGINAKADGV